MEVQAALVHEVEVLWDRLTRGGRGKPRPQVYQRIWAESAKVVSSVDQILRGPVQCRMRWNDIVSVARKKITFNQGERRRTGGGPAELQELSDLDERAAVLTGAHDRSATCGEAELVMALPSSKVWVRGLPRVSGSIRVNKPVRKDITPTISCHKRCCLT